MKAEVLVGVLLLLAMPLAGMNVSIHESKLDFYDMNGEETVELPFNAEIEKVAVNGSAENIDFKWISGGNAYRIKQPPYHIGVGISNGQHVVFLTIYGKKASVEYDYKKAVSFNGEYDLLIITPEKFYKEFSKLAEHKEKHGIKTKVISLNEVYSSYNGRDEAEKIKYCIKDSVEKDGIKYVLLAGDIYNLPIRYVVYHEKWRGRTYNFSMPTDLYYADLYRYENGHVVFSSWDTNNNGVYGEVYYGCIGVNDTIDLYPDVYVGRLACRNVREAKTVVDKIIKYEDGGGEWFKRLLLVGGDTFPGWGIIEGEFMNEYVANIMQGFTPVKMWASDGSISPFNVEMTMEKGGGFLYYSGHGFPYGWATHKPNNENWTGRYFTPYILGLLNGYKLPIIFFDACLTAKLDFNSSDLRNDGVPLPINATFPCFAWYFIAHKGGGAIASIGATRVAFTGVGKNGPYSGASYLAYQFFKAYMNGKTRLGETFVTAQNNYLNHIWDRWTIQEFILLGDPTLQIGGYSHHNSQN